MASKSYEVEWDNYNTPVSPAVKGNALVSPAVKGRKHAAGKSKIIRYAGVYSGQFVAGSNGGTVREDF